MMKKYILLSVLMSILIPGIANAQKNSPYIETLTGNVNNQGFKATSLRQTAIARPVPIHQSTDPINKTVSPRFAVAKLDFIVILNPLVTWAGACGWTTAANSSSATGVIASPATGCQNYSELLAPAGTWRVPTQRELMLIYLTRKELTLSLAGFVDLLTDGTYYWSSSANGSNEAWAIDFSQGIMSNRPKTDLNRVRCVRDL